MEPAEVTLLTSREGRELLAALPRYTAADALALGEGLRASGHPPALVAATLTQARLRTRAAVRWGTAAEPLLRRVLLTPEGAEQATRPAVAAVRAARFARLGSSARVADLGCGVGLDLLALAAAGLAVDGYEVDATTAAVAAANAESSPDAARIQVRHADVLLVPREHWSGYRALFADPARRAAGRRLSRPEDWSPPLSWLLALPVADLGVKVAPGLDHATVDAGTEFAVVSDCGDVVEAGLYRGVLRDPGVCRSATLLPSGARLSDADLPARPPPVGAVGAYLHEPDGAVIRAGLVAAVVDRVGGRLLDPRIAYFTTDAAVDTPFAAAYEVHDVLPFGVKRLRTHLRALDVGGVVVKKRGSAVDVDVLRRSLRLDPHATGRRTLFLTRIGDDPVVVVASPLRSPVRGGNGSAVGVGLEGEVPVVDEG